MPISLEPAFHRKNKCGADKKGGLKVALLASPLNKDLKMSNDLWRTPREVIDYIQSRFGEVKLDLCASDSGHVSDNYIDEECIWHFPSDYFV